MGREDERSGGHKHRHGHHHRHRRSRSASDSSDDERALKKQRKKASKMLASFGYSNETNPFGDSNLTQPFVWRKKYEDAAAAAVPADADSKGKRKHKSKHAIPSERELHKQQLARVEEIRQARKRRDDREREKEEMERLRNEELRLRDAEQYEDWQQKEEEFHRQQTQVRSQLRIQQHREKPVDLLAKNLLLVEHAMQQDEQDAFMQMELRIETRRPHVIVGTLSVLELEELLEHIDAYIDLEDARNAQHKEFWQLMKVITRDRIQRVRRAGAIATADGDASNARLERGAIHNAVQSEVEAMLRDKTRDELAQLQREVEDTLHKSTTTPGIDVEYWEEVAQQVEVALAQARLSELHSDVVKRLQVVLAEHDEAQGKSKRATEVVMTGSSDQDATSGLDESATAQEMENAEAKKGLDASEERLGQADEVALQTAMPVWGDKYQPRKPRYFNRVKTGYDWNKYNQTHYDHDNPPPKVVQGYKFNLFYPDLLDKTTAPRYALEPANSPEFCIIRFSAGAPYQDIAFKIVNRQWEYSHKRGFKSVFERGILHLYFNFKRHRYRR